MKQNNDNGTITVHPHEVQKISLHTDEVQDILGSVPHWTVRSGAGYLLSLILLMGVLCWFIKYPDVIQSPVVLTTPVPPANIVARNAGYIRLLVKDQQQVAKGQYLGYVNNPSDVNAILQLEQELNYFRNNYYYNPAFLIDYRFTYKPNLGELQDSYNNFRLSIHTYQLFMQQQEYEKKSGSVRNEIGNQVLLDKQSAEQNRIMKHELDLAYRAFQRDSTLHAEKVISHAEFEQREITLLEKQRAYRNAVSTLTSSAIQQDRLKGQLQGLSVDEQKEQSKLLADIGSTMNVLYSLLKKWEDDFMISSPMQGKVALFNFWTDNQYIRSGEEVLTVIPDSKTYFARGKAGIAGSGKLKPGQHVNIKLDNYPFHEYGMLTGTVRDISLVPRENNYSLTITLDKQLLTTYNKRIDARQEITGHAEILTENISLLQRIFYRLKKI